MMAAASRVADYRHRFRNLGSNIIILAETSIIICLPISRQNKPSVRSQIYRSFDYRDLTKRLTTKIIHYDKYIPVRLPKMQGMVAGNRSRVTQGKDETMTSLIERMTSQIVSNTFVLQQQTEW